MEDQTLEKLKYPIGEFSKPEAVSYEDIKGYIQTIEDFPDKLIKAVFGLFDEQLDTQYRPEGWTIRQVVHHLADSHINSYVRFKWALTENKPTIKAYDEVLWAEMKDASSAPVEVSLKLLEALHSRWVMTLKNMSPVDFQRKFIHPESKKEINLETNLASYAWHCNHHLAHIVNLKQQKGW